jgi:hypothetical protein
MSVERDILETTVAVASLVNTLLDNFGYAADLHKHLRRRTERSRDDADDSLRRRRSRRSRDERRSSRVSVHESHRYSRDSTYYSDEEEDVIESSRFLVRNEYDKGFRELGQVFAIGDSKSLLTR